MTRAQPVRDGPGFYLQTALPVSARQGSTRTEGEPLTTDNRYKLIPDSVVRRPVIGAHLHRARGWDEFMETAQKRNALEKQERMFGQFGPEPPRELGGVGCAEL